MLYWHKSCLQSSRISLHRLVQRRVLSFIGLLLIAFGHANARSAYNPHRLPGSVPLHVLVRCSWGTSLTREAGLEKCDESFCCNYDSNKAYGEFMFFESLYYEGREDTFTQLIRSKPAQCLFHSHSGHRKYASIEGTPCVCNYQSLDDFCKASSGVEMRFFGDSTMRYFRDDIGKACGRNYGALPQPSGMFSGIVLYEQQTLHRMHLGPTREKNTPYRADMSQRQAEAAGLFLEGGFLENPFSVQAFIKHSIDRIREKMRLAPRASAFVYMENNDACPNNYKGAYKDYWRFLIEKMDVQSLRQAGQRMNVTDIMAVSGFTLDHYGTSFSSSLLREYVLPRFPNILIMPFVLTYPASCKLSQESDGRHFGKMNFRFAKARLLWNVIRNHLPMARTVQTE